MSSSSGGYQLTLWDFVQSLQDAAIGGCIADSCGPIHINLEFPAVDQLWSDLMIPFLSLFGQWKVMVCLLLQETLVWHHILEMK